MKKKTATATATTATSHKHIRVQDRAPMPIWEKKIQYNYSCFLYLLCPPLFIPLSGAHTQKNVCFSLILRLFIDLFGGGLHARFITSYSYSYSYCYLIEIFFRSTFTGSLQLTLHTTAATAFINVYSYICKNNCECSFFSLQFFVFFYLFQ